MGKKYDKAIARINGISGSMDDAVRDIIKDMDDDARSDEMKAIVKRDLRRKAVETRILLDALVEAVDGGNDEKPDKEIARSLIVGSLFTETLLGICGTRD